MTSTNDTKFRSLEDFAGISSDWFWETDSEHRFTYFSSVLKDIAKIDPSKVLGTRRDDVGEMCANDPNWQAHLADLRARRPFRNFEYKINRPNNSGYLWVRVAGQPLFDDAGAFIGYRGTGHDITQEKESIQRLMETNAALAERNSELNVMRRALERSANEDSLTGLLNRRAFERDLSEVLGVVGNDVILIHIDLDRFKWVNDTLGHPAGDSVLVAAAERMRQRASGIGPVYRLGGDEFLIVLADNADRDQARWIADDLVEAMEQPILVDRQEISIGASIGIAYGAGGDVTPRQLVAKVDIALYEAKRAGRGCVRELMPSMLSAIAARRQLASEIPGAIENGEFIPFYQPQIHAGTGAVVGAEALARWQHPEHGLLAPAAFLDVASELGLVAAIDRSMMHQALQFADGAAKQGLLPAISVNLSAGRLIDPKLVDDVDACWTNRQCKLSIELLETISFDELQHEPMVNDNLARLRALGVQIETDDFGSGRASITGLLMVRPDRLKIDRHLVQAATNDPTKRKVVSAILDMTRALGIEVLAEGVETPADIAVIRKLGCHLFQGYAYARPLSEADFLEYLHQMQPTNQMKTASAATRAAHAVKID